ncbi:DNA cytosine methyltransferase [Lysinibacillus sp. NPDC096418]|uniref:DNA cytosine methyltransferase n=1 Tax=Lysinibacillus sp. NPDC096418 TaxID=3364138 RepID=UPI0037FA8E57
MGHLALCQKQKGVVQVIKKRKAKKSNRGLYIQDTELQQTNFEIGNHIKYIVDQKNKKIVIVPTDEITSNKVSKRAVKNGEKPVLDIRNKKALAVFKDADYLQIEILENEIHVSGYENQEQKQGVISSLKNKVNRFISKKKNIIDITTLINVKKTFDVVLSKNELEKVVGQTSYQQLSLFDSVLEQAESCAKKSVNYIKKAIHNLHIPLTAISLFSGCGIMDSAFIDEGYEVAFALELDKDAVETYRFNHSNTIHQGDIRDFDKSYFGQVGASVMFAGPPCQDLSQANQRKDEQKLLDSPKNKLLKEYLDSVNANPNCQVVVIENVPQLLTACNGRFMEEIKNELSDFDISSGILTASEYGDPQERSRAIVIGSKIGKIDLPKPTHLPSQYVTVAQAFEGLHDDIPNQLDFSKSRVDTIQRMSHVPQGGNWRNIPIHLLPKSMLKGDTHSSVYKRLNNDKPSITITNPRKSLITHPELNRTLSGRECARLFSVKDDFIFKGKLSAIQQMICNAVPVKMVRAIAKQIKDAITEHNSMVERNKLCLV